MLGREGGVGSLVGRRGGSGNYLLYPEIVSIMPNTIGFSGEFEIEKGHGVKETGDRGIPP
jgi:hypothetical protein